MPSLRLFSWLLLGGLLQVFYFGQWVVPLAAWLTWVFLLRFTRGMPPFKGLIWMWAVLILALSIANRGVLPIPDPVYLGVVAVIALAAALPFLVDRLLAPRLAGVPATWVFPLAWTVLEFVGTRLNPLGTWGALGYTQHGNLPLMQLASVTGIWGIGFLVTWFAATVNAAWERQFKWESVRVGVLLYAAVWSAVMLAGGLRLAFAPESPTVRVSGIGWPKNMTEPQEFVRAIAPDITGNERQQLRRTFVRLEDSFFERSRREVQAGAKIVVWPEANLMVFHGDEAAFLERARGFAREQNIFLLVGMGVLKPGAARPVTNNAVLVNPAGDIAFSYTKITAVPGFEAQTSVPGTGPLPVVGTPYGRIASAICFDLDFPQIIRHIGYSHADLMLVPASDYRDLPAVGSLHQRMAELRAIENGVAMVRVTRWGVSGAVDPFGRRLAISDDFTTHDNVLVAQVPISAGVRTAYAAVGDLFAWLCVAGLIGAIGAVLLRHRRPGLATVLSADWIYVQRPPNTRTLTDPLLCNREVKSRPP